MSPAPRSRRAPSLRSSTSRFRSSLRTEQVAGVYNIIYRHLFDRRRDLPIPISFLLDANGMIVKVYQGLFDVPMNLTPISIRSGQRRRRAWRRRFRSPACWSSSTFQRNDFTYGVAMYQHGYLEQAAESFQQVIAAKPDNADAYYNLGTLKLRSNDFDEARRYLEQTVKLQPNYPEAWNNLGMMAAQQGQPEEAINDFQQSHRSAPQVRHRAPESRQCLPTAKVVRKSRGIALARAPVAARRP